MIPREQGEDVAGPYRGLEPFEERDAAFFFGRERETRLITASLFAAPLTLLYGASGVGKSSVLRAGVLPRLRERKDLLPVVFPTIASERAASSVVVRGWQSDPLGGIKETVALALFESAAGDPGLRSRYNDVVLRHEMGSLREFVVACSEAAGRRLMVILDQFEEYSLYHPDDEAFAEQFPDAITPGDRSVSFLVSLREDALAKLDRFKGRIPTLWDSYRRVDHLDRAAAEDAIRLPLREFNRRQPPGEPPVEIEDALVDAVLRDVQAESVQFESTGSGTLGPGPGSGGRIETPYLQLVMTRLWEREQAEGSRRLRLTTLLDEGGAGEIVRTHLDRVMQQFTPEERDVAARVFHRLVTPSGAKIAFSVHDLAAYETIEVDQLAPILRRLEEGSRRILRRVAVRSDAPEDPRYEIFHDRLGKAILAWRTKRLEEQARELSQRQEAEQRRIANEVRAGFRETVDGAMHRLGAEARATWAKMMLYLVATSGLRLAQTAHDLALHSDQAVQDVGPVLEYLTKAGILRHAYGPGGSTGEVRYEVAHEAIAGALLEWHSQYVLSQTHAATGAGTAPLDDVSSAVYQPPRPAPEPRFPYAMAYDLLREGRVIPFLGAGVSLSARPQDAAAAAEKKPFLPSGRELKELLARECDFPAGEFEASDLAEVASFCAQVAGRPWLDDLLAGIFGRPDYTPSQTHALLAEVAESTPLVILTTNYDTLMEQALDQAAVPYDVVAYLQDKYEYHEGFAVLEHGASKPSVQRAGDIFPHERTVVVRLHGALFRNGRTMGSFVITEEDQLGWISLLKTEPSPLPVFVQAHLSKRSVLWLGHSAHGWTQRALVRALDHAARHGYAKGVSWAVSLRPSHLSVMAWQRYDVKAYDEDLNEWAARMREVDPGISQHVRRGRR